MREVPGSNPGLALYLLRVFLFSFCIRFSCARVRYMDSQPARCHHKAQQTNQNLSSGFVQRRDEKSFSRDREVVTRCLPMMIAKCRCSGWLTILLNEMAPAAVTGSAGKSTASSLFPIIIRICWQPVPVILVVVYRRHNSQVTRRSRGVVEAEKGFSQPRPWLCQRRRGRRVAR